MSKKWDGRVPIDESGGKVPTWVPDDHSHWFNPGVVQGTVIIVDSTMIGRRRMNSSHFQHEIRLLMPNNVECPGNMRRFELAFLGKEPNVKPVIKDGRLAFKGKFCFHKRGDGYLLEPL